jgi:chorismate mutase
MLIRLSCLTTACPAVAARRMSWTFVPLLTFSEIDVVGGLACFVRVLIHLNTELRQDQIVHVFLEGARVLSPDFAAGCLRHLKARDKGS